MRLDKVLWLTLFSLLSFSYAQNSFVAALFGGGLNTEERLLYKKPVGPYLVTIDGSRIIGRAYLELEVTERGRPIARTSEVRVSVTPPAQAASASASYNAVFSEGRFVIDPLPLRATRRWQGTDSWRVDLDIRTPKGRAETDFGLQVYPAKPAASMAFRVANVALPLVVLALLWGSARLTRQRLERPRLA